jgi:hypothetical protein
MNWPQIILLCMYFVSSCVSWYDHGKPRVGKNNAWHGMIAIAINLFLLYAGGFFN